MDKEKNFEAIIIGGSYSGLSAAMALGRSLRRVLIIDSGEPCNRSTPHSHNFITQDGEAPTVISRKAKEQVLNYDTVSFYKGLAVQGAKVANGFSITTDTTETFYAKKLIFATGIKDIMPAINGFAECWGRSIIHCPYCHGYEVRHKKTGILGNGEYGFEFSKVINNWTDDLTLFTNGKSELTREQAVRLLEHTIEVVEKEIDSIEHKAGQIKNILFKDGSKTQLEALYARVPFEQHSDLPAKLGCTINDMGHLEVDDFQQTTVSGIFACGDNTTFFRSVASAVAMGNVAGAMLNKSLIEESF